MLQVGTGEWTREGRQLPTANGSAAPDSSMVQQVRMLIHRDNIQLAECLTLDPGGHLSRLDVTWLLPFHLPWVARYGSS